MEHSFKQSFYLQVRDLIYNEDDTGTLDVKE